MSARFRIRTSQGQEISFASHEMFADFVRTGELSPEDVVYDAETREWSSALTHPVVLQIEAEAEEAEAPRGASAGGGDDEADLPGEEEGGAAGEGGAASPTPTGGDIGLELAPEPDRLSPEEEAAAFVQRMEAERASELDFGEDAGVHGLKMEKRSSGLVDEFGLVRDREAPRTPQRRPTVDPPRAPPSPSPLGAPRRDAPSAHEARAQSKEPPKRRKTGDGALRRYGPLLIVGAVVAIAGLYLGPGLLGSTGGEGTDPPPDSIELPPPPQPLIPDTEEALRERAQERFLATTRTLIGELPEVPDIWLDGQYLAAPSEYPEVRDAWVGVMTLVRQVRAGDNERYRAGYNQALDDALVSGSTRALRLAGAVGDFQSREGPRAAHYDRAEALAMAVLRGHDALEEAEGTIAYEPAASTPVSGDPVIQAVGRNADAQALLDEVLDMILAELDEPDGPGSAANLREWIWEGILGAVAN